MRLFRVEYPLNGQARTNRMSLVSPPWTRSFSLPLAFSFSYLLTPPHVIHVMVLVLPNSCVSCFCQLSSPLRVGPQLFSCVFTSEFGVILSPVFCFVDAPDRHRLSVAANVRSLSHFLLDSMLNPNLAVFSFPSRPFSPLPFLFLCIRFDLFFSSFRSVLPRTESLLVSSVFCCTFPVFPS